MVQSIVSDGDGPLYDPSAGVADFSLGFSGLALSLFSDFSALLSEASSTGFSSAPAASFTQSSSSASPTSVHFVFSFHSPSQAVPAS
ncbi:hypothetical protein MTO96_030613 [Rhipicephalus appendiculatus]